MVRIMKLGRQMQSGHSLRRALVLRSAPRSLELLWQEPEVREVHLLVQAHCGSERHAQHR